MAFKLAHNGKELDDKKVVRIDALKGIMRWVKLNPYNISQKVQVVVGHFRKRIAPLLNGRGKALVIVSSQLEVVCWRLAGIAAVQTLSRLNRGYPGKDTTYVVDFVNDPEEILAAFKTYYDTAVLANVSDPNLVFDLRMKLDAAGYYDEFEVNRVVEVEFSPQAKQSELTAALEPAVSRLLQRYKSAQEKLRKTIAKLPRMHRMT